jgi:hypothetical protein
VSHNGKLGSTELKQTKGERMTMSLYKVTVTSLGGYMTEELIVKADNEDAAFDKSLDPANAKDWKCTAALEFCDGDVTIEEVTTMPISGSTDECFNRLFRY